MEKGKVKYFNNKEDKRFGFIIPDGGTDADAIFFHYNGFRKFEASKGKEVVFSSTGYGHPVAFPKAGELVCYELRNGPKGPVAQPWGYNHDFLRVKKESADRPIYGDSFVFISLCEGNLPESELLKFGSLTRVPEEKREDYIEILYSRGFNGPFRFTKVIPNPGMEKRLGRAFRMLAYQEKTYSHKAIEIVEIPEQYVYNGVLEYEFLKTTRSLTYEETQKLVAISKPAFSYSEYWHTWSRILGYYEDGYTREVAVALTCPDGWDTVRSVSIYAGSPGHSAEKNEGPFSFLPDSVREDMEEELGAELTKELLTENYLRLFSVPQLKTAERNHTGGGWLNLNEVTSTKVRV